MSGLKETPLPPNSGPHFPLIARRDKWLSVVPTSMPRSVLASRILGLWLLSALLSLGFTLNLQLLYPPRSFSFLYNLPFQPRTLFVLWSPPWVPSPFVLCSGPLQLPLAVLSLTSTIETFSSAVLGAASPSDYAPDARAFSLCRVDWSK